MNGFWQTVFNYFPFGLKARLNNLEKRQDELSKSVRYADTCEKMHEALDTRLSGIESMQKEMRGDIKELLRRKE